jgi:predicted O-methyltransferase YrrM
MKKKLLKMKNLHPSTQPALDGTNNAQKKDLNISIYHQMVQKTLDGHGDTNQHSLTISSLIISNKCENIIELGVRFGDSTVPLLFGATVVGGNSRVTSVDIESPEEQAKRISKPIIEFDDNFNSRWKFVKQDAISFLKEQSARIDFIFIDDWHGENHVFEELTIIDKLVDNTSLILLHDTMYYGSHPYYNETVMPEGHDFEGKGVYGALTRFVEEYPNYEYCTIPINHGLTILRKVK